MDQRLESLLPRMQKPALYTCGEYRQQGYTKENLFHIPN